MKTLAGVIVFIVMVAAVVLIFASLGMVEAIP